MSDRASVARAAARAGARVASEAFRTDLDVETKAGPTDVVTRADREAQVAVVDRIHESFPDDVVVGEESDLPREVPDKGAAWVVDPIDGTNNFVAGVRSWVTSVAAVIDGEPVAAANVAPALDDEYTAGVDGGALGDRPLSVSETTDPRALTVVPTFWWDYHQREAYAAVCRGIVERFGDLRRVGSAQLVLSFLASGAVDGVVTELPTNPWDTVAGVHLVRQAGGKVTDVDGEPWRHDSVGLVASNGQPGVHERLFEVVREGRDAGRDESP
jgi:myo-inositol-1(or 4)-monophosphatase